MEVLTIRIETWRGTFLCSEPRSAKVALIQDGNNEGINSAFELHPVEPFDGSNQYYIKTSRAWLAAREDCTLGHSDEVGPCNVFKRELVYDVEAKQHFVSLRTCYDTYITAKRRMFLSVVDHSATQRGEHERFILHVVGTKMSEERHAPNTNELTLPPLRRSWFNVSQKAALGVGGTLIAMPVALTVAGFGSTGVVAGSIAAAIQSSIGNVAAGSAFATMQSLGATGAFTSAVTYISVAASTTAAVMALGDPKGEEAQKTEKPGVEMQPLQQPAAVDDDAVRPQPQPQPQPEPEPEPEPEPSGAGVYAWRDEARAKMGDGEPEPEPQPELQPGPL